MDTPYVPELGPAAADLALDARWSRGTLPLRNTALVWIGYVLLLGLIDMVLAGDAMPLLGFYLVHLGGALGLLLFVLCVQHSTLADHSVPLSILWIVALTVVAALPSVAGGPPFSAESLALRGLPIMMLALVLVAWRYAWPQVVAFSGGTALLAGAPLLLPVPADAPSMAPAVTVVAIQATSFLAMGGAVALLMRQLRFQQHALERANGQLRSQQQALEQANSQLRAFADVRERLAASQERSRIARELHDTLAHTLSGLSIQLEGAEACWEPDPQRARAIVTQARGVVRGGLHETRRALKALRASPLEHLGLVGALQQLATVSTAQTGLRLALELAAEIPDLAESVEQCVYRVAQEAIINVVRHAAATTLWVQLRADQQRVELVIRDDGRGFDLQRALPPDRYGLRGLRERTENLGGELSMQSQPGVGTTVRLLIGL